MFGTKPLIERLDERFRGPHRPFGQILPAVDATLPSIPNASPVDHALEPAFREPTLPEAFAAIQKRLVDAKGDGEVQGALLGDFFELRGRVETFFGDLEAARRSDLEAQLLRIREDGRACADELKAARTEASALQGRWNVDEGAASKARANLMALRDSRPSDDVWPTPAEISEWESKVAEAEAQVERWRVSQDAQQKRIDAANAKVAQITRRLAVLSRRREDITAELSGEQRSGPHGLVIPAAK